MAPAGVSFTRSLFCFIYVGMRACVIVCVRVCAHARVVRHVLFLAPPQCVECIYTYNICTLCIYALCICTLYIYIGTVFVGLNVSALTDGGFGSCTHVLHVL
jgi:hypothetical protein